MTPDREHGTAPLDPVRVRRARVAHWTLVANRSGYVLMAVAIAGFVVTWMAEFPQGLTVITVVALVASCVLLAPSIVLGYAVKAAERDDRERGL